MKRWINLPFVVSIFISAALVFLIQPIVAKSILPQFGGGASVWLACMLYFQFNLFLGYLYAFLLTRLFKPRLQVVIHTGMLVGALVLLRLHFDTNMLDGSNQVVLVFSTLFWGLCIPCLVLSASSPLLQHWYYMLKKVDYPFWFYSVSNLGSLLGLLIYPFVLELFLPMGWHKLIWTSCFYIYIATCTFCMIPVLYHKAISKSNQTKPISYWRIALWIGLAFLGCLIFLSVTQLTTSEIYNMPLIWLVPLTLYLTSFIIVFARGKAFRFGLWSMMFYFTVISYVIVRDIQSYVGLVSFVVLCGVMFSACMICHGLLIKSRPQNDNSPIFYLSIAFGGLLAGLSANFAAPIIFNSIWEFHIPIFLLLLALMLNEVRKLDANAFIVFSSSVAIACFGFHIYNQEIDNTFLLKKRNFYGIKKVYKKIDENNFVYNLLVHGLTVHGMQSFSPKYQNIPTGYYHEKSGLGLTMKHYKSQPEPIHMGVIGLGAGGLAIYIDKKDSIKFYEIDEDVLKIANKHFTYLADTQGKVEVKIGDARLLMHQELNSNQVNPFDILVVDAFNGGSPPFHLMTDEAIKLYKQHLSKNGAILVNISSRYFDFFPVISALAKKNDLAYLHMYSADAPDSFGYAAKWIILTNNQNVLNWLISQKVLSLPTPVHKKQHVWTDEFNSLIPVLTIAGL